MVLLTMAIAPSVFCQEYYKPNDYYKAINYPTYTITNTPKGDILTGMVFFDVDVFSRDLSVTNLIYPRKMKATYQPMLL